MQLSSEFKISSNCSDAYAMKAIRNLYLQSKLRTKQQRKAEKNHNLITEGKKNPN